jgi:16S rRNA processing protein RimM
MLENLLIGEVVSVHGIRGGLKVKALTDYPERFKNTAEVDVKLPSDSARSKELSHRYKVCYASVAGNTAILLLEGIDDRNTAELYRGATLSVPREAAVALPEDTYFIGDLVGSNVYELTDNAALPAEADSKPGPVYDAHAPGVELLGKVFEVIPTGSNDAYGVRTPDKQIIYIPAIASVVRHVDVRRGEIFVKLLPGLKEVYLGGDTGSGVDGPDPDMQ